MPMHLQRRDLLEYEAELCRNFAQLVPFASHALYFPQEADPLEPVWISRERCLLIPLFQPRPAGHGGVRELLGVFTARQVKGKLTAAMLGCLPGLAALCMENVALCKAGRLDAETGLSLRHVLLERLAQEIGAIQSAFAENEETGSGSLGLVSVHLGGLHSIMQEHGPVFAARMQRHLAQAFAAALPEGALAVKSGDQRFSALLPAGSRIACERCARNILENMDKQTLPGPLTGRGVGLRAHVGFALYPQDMDGLVLREAGREMGRELGQEQSPQNQPPAKAPEFSRSEEQARHLLQRADYAAEVAAKTDTGRRIMPYGRIVQEGCRVLRALPLSRVLVSAGRVVGAREGQRFAVWSPASQNTGDGENNQSSPVFKGEIALVEVRHSEAVAEVSQLGDVAVHIQPGDVLSLLPESGLYQSHSGGERQRDEATGLLRYNDFLADWAAAREGHDTFSLALIHVSRHDESAPYATPYSGEEAGVNARLAMAAEGVRRRFGAETLAGRFGRHSLIVFHPGSIPGELLSQYESLSVELGAAASAGQPFTAQEEQAAAAVGLAGVPFLHVRPAEVVDCALKALGYAQLLPAPHVGVFDSLAMTISADKLHCLGDVFGAVEEYKMALLADADNALAWNSLGVCMAGLGKHAEARRHFGEAFKRTPGDAALAYNLGAVCLALGEHKEARTYFEMCLQSMPKHLFAMVRLGQIAEAGNNAEEARKHYEAAAAVGASSSLPFRHLARLCLNGGNRTEAREHLHKALQQNPRDAIALQIMAGLYLDGGEDPLLAESLAKHSVALRPERKAGWMVLARALEQQGKSAEARHALLQAGEV